MAQELDDLDFWLPSEFLTDDYLLTDRFGTRGTDDFSYGFRNSFGVGSDVSSPVESVTGPMETESDEDDLITELSRKFAYSTLQDSNLSSDYTTKGWRPSGSPRSTLCGLKPASRGGSNSVSRVCSPQDGRSALTWDWLNAAGEEVMRMRMIEEAASFYSTKLFGPPPKPNPVTMPQHNPNSASGFYLSQFQRQAQLSCEQFQAAQFQQMNQHHVIDGVNGQGGLRYQLHNGSINGAGGRAQGLSMSAWPTLQQSQQQQPVLGMRAVLFGETGAKKERVGTGVFMPRRFSSNPTGTPGCSTVLLPDRLDHTMNLDLDAQVQSNGGFKTQYDAVSKQRGNTMTAQPVMNQELRLPQEWTY
ncbi:uncharacterized protein LOC105161579 isoform X2 [Sesamum indicum]|uniref:Uncharacterized protein LOC105161579 isoform X2 n=1 Tax=Sesamum indicum TaxID=4182 RepID=A0A6I9TAG1_SESIN|nr:uncharacterized protein LOC105161579 isoform X2 [Sesamum indicum]